MPGTVDDWPNWRLALPEPLEEIERLELPRAIAASLGSAMSATPTGRSTSRRAGPVGSQGVDLPVLPPVSPMLAKLSRELPEGDVRYEPKWDGFRCIIFRDGDEIELGSRNERPLTRYFPDVVDAARAQLPERCVVDGEVVIAGAGGLDFDALSQRIHPAASRVTMLARQTPASFVAFDLLGARRPRSAPRPVLSPPGRARTSPRWCRSHPCISPRSPPIPPSLGAGSNDSKGAGLDGVVAKPAAGDAICPASGPCGRSNTSEPAISSSPASAGTRPTPPWWGR